MKHFFASLFSFSGRLGRLRFALYGLLWFVVSFAALLAATEIFDLSILAGDSLWLWEERLPSFLAIAALCWTMMSLTVQRIRDMGFRPLPIALLLMAIAAVDVWLLPELTVQRLPAPLEDMTPLGAALSFGSVIWLQFWPSARGGGAPSAV